MPFLDTPPDSLLGLPREYAFLLYGLIVGVLIGWWVGRSRGKRTGSVQHGSGAETAVVSSAEAKAAPSGINLVVNGRNIDVPPEAMAEIQYLLRAGKKIEAIKVLQEASGFGLAEARAVMDSLEKVLR